MVAQEGVATMKHLRGIDDLALADIAAVFDTIWRYRAGEAFPRVLEGKQVCLAFFQPSTRTRVGFQRAVGLLGGTVTGFSGLGETRAVPPYGESMTDSLQVLAQMTDALVLRSPVDLRALDDVAWLDVPLVNAGDGHHEHPVQALTDAWCIASRRPEWGDLTLGLVGDVGARVVRSLLKLCVRLGLRRCLAYAPDVEVLPPDLAEMFLAFGVHFEFVDKLEDLAAHSDAIEVMPYRMPDSARGPAPPDPARTVTQALVRRCNPQLLVLHPGPRSWELHPDTDELTHSLFYEQVRAGCGAKLAALMLLLAPTVLARPELPIPKPRKPRAVHSATVLRP
jgi:aspartate carbamoyltransferase catalytic subunit